jgi:hypothetical protein
MDTKMTCDERLRMVTQVVLVERDNLHREALCEEHQDQRLHYRSAKPLK